MGSQQAHEFRPVSIPPLLGYLDAAAALEQRSKVQESISGTLYINYEPIETCVAESRR